MLLTSQVTKPQQNADQQIHWMYIFSCSWTSATSFTPNLSFCSSMTRNISSSCRRWISRSWPRSSGVIVASIFCCAMRCFVCFMCPGMWLQNFTGSDRAEPWSSSCRSKLVRSTITQPNSSSVYVVARPPACLTGQTFYLKEEISEWPLTNGAGANVQWLG